MAGSTPQGGVSPYDPQLQYATAPQDQLIYSGDSVWQVGPNGGYVQVADPYSSIGSVPMNNGMSPPTQMYSQPAPVASAPALPEQYINPGSAVLQGMTPTAPPEPWYGQGGTNTVYAPNGLQNEGPSSPYYPSSIPSTYTSPPMSAEYNPDAAPANYSWPTQEYMNNLYSTPSTISTPQNVDPWAAAMAASGQVAGAAPAAGAQVSTGGGATQQVAGGYNPYAMATLQQYPPGTTPSSGTTGGVSGSDPYMMQYPTSGGNAPAATPSPPVGSPTTQAPAATPTGSYTTPSEYMQTPGAAEQYANSGGNQWYQVGNTSMTPDQYAQYQASQPQQLQAPALPPGYTGPSQVTQPAGVQPTTYSNGTATTGGVTTSPGGQTTGTPTTGTGTTGSTAQPFQSTSQMVLPTIQAPGAAPTIPSTPTIAMPGAVPTAPELNLSLPQVGADGSFAGMAGGAPPAKLAVPLVSDQQMNQMLNQAYSQNAMAAAGNQQGYADQMAGRGFSTQSSAMGDYQQMQDFARMNADMTAYSQIPLNVQKMNADYLLQASAQDAQNRGLSIDAYTQSVNANNLNNQAQLAQYGLGIQGYGAQNDAMSQWQQAQNDLYGTQAQLYGMQTGANNAYSSLLNQQAQLQLAQQGQDLDAYNAYQAAINGYYGIGNDSRQTDVAAYQAYNNSLNQMMQNQIALMTGMV